MKKFIVRWWGAIGGVLVVLAVFGLGFVLDTKKMEGVSRQERVATLEERVKMLEEMMREKTRPVIHIERGTVYNSDGEIVIEERKK